MKRVLPSPARELWREHGGVLLEHLGRLTAGARGQEAWRLGGGTMLAARWRHRQSSDIDIAIATNLPRRLVNSVCAGIVEALDERGLDIERDEDNDLIQAATNKNDPDGRKQGIDPDLGWNRRGGSRGLPAPRFGCHPRQSMDQGGEHDQPGAGAGANRQRVPRGAFLAG